MQFVDLSEEPSRLFQMFQLLLTGHEAIENPGRYLKDNLSFIRKDKKNCLYFYGK